MAKQRLDQAMVTRGFTQTRSQAENWIRLGEVFVDGWAVTKPGFMVADAAKIELRASERYVSRAALKLASVASTFKLDFKDKVVLDVGSSTGGFTDYALQHGARRVIAVDSGTNQLHPSLRADSRVDVREQTDIRDVASLPATPDIVLADVSFISLQEVLPHIAALAGKHTRIVAMAKPQFEAGDAFKHKGVVKNSRMRRDILQRFEQWAAQHFVITSKADSQVAGAKGNVERFYVLTPRARL